MELGLGPIDFVLDGDPAPPPQKGGGAPKFLAHAYCRQAAGCMKQVFGMELGLSPGDVVLDGDPAPFPKRGGAPSPIVGPFLLRPNGWMHHDSTSYGCRPQPRGLCVRWRPSSPPQQGGGAPSQTKKSALVYCGQTAGWINMPLGTRVGLSSGDSVLDGDPAPLPQKEAEPPNFRSMSIVAKRLDGPRWHLERR